MPSKILITILILSSSLAAIAQLHDNDYRNADNKYYWQNRKPDNAYWQQDVQYNIYATMREDSNVIDGHEGLTYWNNSPDTLTYVYFHLYQNAFIRGSHLHNLELANNVKPHMGKKEAAGKGNIIDNIKVDGKPTTTKLDNTIMKVYLPAPLYPGHKTLISMDFLTYYDNGATRRRMQMWNAWGFMHYNGCQWFPKLCVYDRMHGWDTYQHLDREFYGDYGLYDVTLDFPSNYVMEASGVLQNPEEVLPDTLRSKLDISNFSNKKWEEPPSIITPYKKGERKKWHYLANNVHDFAFTADPSFRIGSTTWHGVQCVAIVQEPHARGWQNAPQYIAKIIETFSDSIGMYCYPKIVAADARDGMEYPMITMDGGSDPGYRGLFIHEIGHNWFYGQVGNNETYRAALDEGFTQYLTAMGVIAIEGDASTRPKGKPTGKHKYRQRFSAAPTSPIEGSLLNRYAYDAINDATNLPLNTHSDDFHSALGQGGGYGQVYFKTGSMLYNLQYVLGDSLFHAAMHHYFEQWKFAHPYFEDFRASVIQFTHVDLSWFFDEWFETTKKLDYGIGRIHKAHGADMWDIKFLRTGEMQMPVDFTVTSKDNKKYNFYIPNTWFEKSTTAKTLPVWYGWGKMENIYHAHVQIPHGIKSVQIDTTYRFADLDNINNSKTRGLPISPMAIKTSLDGGLAPAFDRRQYHLYLRPDLWYNPIDGIKAGIHFEGDYLRTLYVMDGSIWWNTQAGQQSRYKLAEGQPAYSSINYTFNYLSPLVRSKPKLQLQLNSRYLDGLWYQRGGLNWLTDDHNTLQLSAQWLWRDFNGGNYLIDPTEWSSTPAQHNASLNMAWLHRYNYMSGSGKLTLSAHAPFMAGNNAPFDYSYTQLEAVNYTHIKKLEVRTRLFGRLGFGNNIPYESMLYLAGSSPEEQMDNKYTRSVGFLPTEWEGISRYNVNHYQEGGGLNLRGYAGYFAPDIVNGTMREGYKGRSGASANVEIDFENYMPYSPRLLRNWLHVNVYAFADAGIMELSNYSLPNFPAALPTDIWGWVHTDAGLGAAFTIKSWGLFEKAKPLTIRFDIPMFLNRPPLSNDNYFTLRYVIGVNRAF